MVKVFDRSPIFYCFTAFYIAIAAILWFFFPKGHLVLWFNERYSDIPNFFFKYMTNFGDGLFSLLVCLILLFFRFYWAWLVFLSYGASSLVAQFLKKMVFPNFDRPKGYFGNSVQMQFVDGVEIFSYNSFPSGHTTSAFALACMLALIFPKRWTAVILGSLAILAGISRIYLAQHFIEDTCFGAIIGTVISTIVFYFYDKNSNWKSSPKSLLNLKK